MATEDRMTNKDNGRKWMWWFLGVLAALQLYFVRELLAAFALFALAFAASACTVISLYMLQKGWEGAVPPGRGGNTPVVTACPARASPAHTLLAPPSLH